MQILPNSPTQDGNDAILSFFVNLPGGTTMPSELLGVIFTSSPNVISQPSTVNTTNVNPPLSSEQTANLIPVTVNGTDPLAQVWALCYLFILRFTRTNCSPSINTDI